MRNNRCVEITVFLAVFFNVSIGQIPLDIRNNSVVGIGGIIVNETTFSEAVERFRKHPSTVANFKLSFQTEDGGSVYSAIQQKDMLYFVWSILVRRNIVSFVMLKIEMKDENVLRGVYEEILKRRLARLGYPSSESGTRKLAWTYPKTTYLLALSRRDSDGILNTTETVGVNK